MRYKFFTVFLFIVLIFGLSNKTYGCFELKSDTTSNILILHSYEENYRWTDNLTKGIRSVLLECDLNISISIEYMDTKRHQSSEYLHSLYSLYEKKYNENSFDLIISCDNAAFDFMQEMGDSIFGDTPYVFCGINSSPSSLAKDRNYTGIIETSDIYNTLRTALKMNPDAKNVYLINDSTLTGKAIRTRFLQVKPYFDSRVTFTEIGNMSVDEIATLLSKEDKSSIALFLVYFCDGDNRLLEYDESIEIISTNSQIPIYGLWEFYLGHGIVGGNLTSGFIHGKQAAEYAIDILNGKNPNDIPIATKAINNYIYDMDQINNFGIDKTKLPYTSHLINDKKDDKKSILAIHSYHSTFSWTNEILKGINYALSDQDAYEITHEFMDTRNFYSTRYIHMIHEVLIEKYKDKKYDLIIVSDEDAFSFATLHRKDLFNDTPIVFCGLNRTQLEYAKEQQNMTGIIENIDIEETINLAISQNPNASSIVFITDDSTSTKNVTNEIKALSEKYAKIDFSFLHNETMDNLKNKLSELSNETIVFLVTFQKDANNNTYTREETGKLISESANTPVYVVYDLYLGTGVLGGKVTNGYNQGLNSGELAKKILNGVDINKLQIIENSPNEYIFDNKVLSKYNIPLKTLPENSMRINVISTFFERNLAFIIITIILCIVIFLISLIYRHGITKNNQKHESYINEIRFDPLTQAYNRKLGLELLENEISESSSSRPLTICFIDLDNLKVTNDQYGHDAGDLLLSNTISYIRQSFVKDRAIIRLGGDEFLIIFPNTTIPHAKNELKMVDKKINFYNKHNKIPISFSYGFSTYSNNITIKQLIDKADKEMYLAKKQKKSRTKRD